MKKKLPFRFKKFAVHHDRCGMKVGTDAVLLGSWVDVSQAKRILEVGTGSGVIALMLAQRTGDAVQIDAIEIEKADALQATENVMRSPWPDKISVIENALQKFSPGVQYDLIVSNPPFFIDSLLPPAPQRRRTRHTQSLSFDELILHAKRLMKASGRFAVVLPVPEGNDFKQRATTKGLYVRRQLAFYARKEKPQERWLFEFGFTQGLPREDSLVLYDGDQVKSGDYTHLTEDFYL